MSNTQDLLTPVGRLVQGSLYDPQKTDAENKPLVIKSGVNTGQPRVNYYFAIAVPKGAECAHPPGQVPQWAHTEWGAKIWAVGQAGFPNGQTLSPNFAWKVTDGDSQVPNRVGKKPCDREGYPGHWVLGFSGMFAPGIYEKLGDKLKELIQPNAINLGDYIQINGSVSDNGSVQQPGIYLNHSMVCLLGYGPRIVIGPDPHSVGFGGQLPAGASLTPLAGLTTAPTTVFAPAATYVPPQQPALPAHVALSVAVPTVPVTPYPQILMPPAQALARVMLPPANGATYEQLIGVGWTDKLLIERGMMQA